MTDLQLQELGPCKRKLSVKIPSERVKQAVQRGWQNAQYQVQMKGFRPGKVPRSILEKKYGEEIRKEIKQHLINDAFRQAVEKHALRPVVAPSVDLTKLDLDTTRELQFDLDFEVVPQFEVDGFKDVEVKVPKVDVTEEIVEREIESLRGKLAQPQTITGEPAAKGDFMRAKLSIRVDGAIVKTVDDAVVDTRGDKIDGIATEGGTASFEGKNLGDKVTVPVKWPEGYEPATFKGAEAHLDCEILEINRFILPPVDEAFVARFGIESVDEFRTQVKKQVEMTIQHRRNQFIEERVFDSLIERTTFPMPEDTLKMMTEQGVHRVAHEMMRSGMADKEAHTRAEQYVPKIREQNERSLRISFLVDRIASKEQIAVTEQDLENAVRALAQQQRKDPQQLADELIANDGVGQLRAQVLDAKVRRLLRESAKVIDVEPSAEAPAGTT